jgi:hypothetical protein
MQKHDGLGCVNTLEKDMCMQWFLLAAAMQKSLIAKFNSTLFLSAPG